MTNIYCIRPKGFNIGNEAINVGLRYFLSRAFGEPVNIINLPATSRYESHNKAGFSPATVHEINQYGDGVIVGGGNLYENGELDVNGEALKALDAPLMLFSLSLGYIYNRRGELVRRTDTMPDATLRALHDAADLSLARDASTVQHLREAGCESVLGGCPTLFITEFPQHLIALGDTAPDVLVSVRTPNLMSIPISYRINVEDHIRQIAAHLGQLGYERIRLLCHDHRDIPFAASFGELDYIYTDDVYEYLSLLKHARLNVTYRLHSFLPCLSYGTPAVKISYDERASSVLDMIGLRDWNIDMVRDADPVASVLDRVARLDDLNRLREQAQPRWQELLRVQVDSTNEFAGLVRAYQRRNTAALVVPA